MKIKRLIEIIANRKFSALLWLSRLKCLPAMMVVCLGIVSISGCGADKNAPEKVTNKSQTERLKENTADRKALASNFVEPPKSIQTSVYWYWISNHLSKEGVIRDLHAMKDAGINRAFIGNIGLDDLPFGKVKMLSEQWWEILHVALKTATELDIEIGIFNSPGWSQSGGPWVKAENSMRYLISSETRVNGPAKFSKKLKRPHDIYQDVKVIAYPVPESHGRVLDNNNSMITASPKLSELATLLDGDISTGVKFTGDGNYTFDIKADKAFTARSLSVRSLEVIMKANVLFQAKNNNGEFTTVKAFEIDRSNASIEVGFVPFAPVVLSFPAVTASEFRLVVDYEKPKGPYIAPGAKLSGLAEIVISQAPRVERYAEKTLAKMHATPMPYWKEYQWSEQASVADKSLVIDPARVLDISEHMSSDGTLNWDVPEGEWVIQRSGMTPTGTTNGPSAPEAMGYEVDKLSKEHAEMHFYGHMGEVLKRIPAEDRKTFKVVVQDSYEKGGQNFTDGFLEEFAEVYGYDPLPYLPVYQGIVVKSQQASDGFLWDMRRLVANKVAYDYVAGLREVSHKHGLTTWLENYGHWGFPGEFLMYGGQSDEIAGEFWSEGELGNIENRAATSAGHIYGKTKISAESNTAGLKAFYRYPGIIKQRSDRFFAEGINNTLLHVMITQPYEDKFPGVNAWFGTEFNRKNTWFSQIDVYTQYLKRTNYMLQQGLNVADIAYFIGEDTPKMTGVTDPEAPIGYQFDYMNAEVIEKYMTVEDGLITLPHGTQYSIMVLPKLETMRPALLAKIKQLVNEGAVILGPPPSRSPSLQDQPQADQQVQSMAAQLWGDVDGITVKSRKVGKGMIINGLDMTEAFALLNTVPDVKLPEDNSIHYGHRTLDGQDIYFITNQTEDTKIVTPEFRVIGKQPELWQATTGYRRDLPAYQQSEQTTAVPLKLEPLESVFVVFSKPVGPAKVTGIAANYPEAKLVSDITTPWNVTFDSTHRGPKEAVSFPSLIDWTASDDDRIKYYSGTAFYSNTFTLDKLQEGEQIVIDLGKFTAMAKVTVNGQYVGGLWTAPTRLDISKFVNKGENSLKIEIVNTWVNRIIGDMHLPEQERKTWMLVNPYDAQSPLQTSGLLGPVKISTVTY
ncbi:glycosyl hydrolase [Colwellia demingiae]|nr:glycosyl hydrolase [Colwellia demingiae]